MVFGRTHSTPGPDGLPYDDWKHPCASRLLYSCYLALFVDRISTLPDDMPRSLMIFLPKGTGPNDATGQAVSRSAPNTRPLSLGNTDVKLLVAACISPVVANTSRLVGPEQTCAAGRDTIENAVKAEAWG
eukprot:1410155-Pyramimonas_sp.AAC.1